MLIACIEQKIMLNRESRNPNIIRWDWTAQPPQIVIHSRVEIGCCLVRQQHPHIWLTEELLENGLILISSRATHKTGTEFTQCKKWQPYFRSSPDAIYYFNDAAGKVSVSIGIEQNSHFHISGSI